MGKKNIKMPRAGVPRYVVSNRYSASVKVVAKSGGQTVQLYPLSDHFDKKFEKQVVGSCFVFFYWLG